MRIAIEVNDSEHSAFTAYSKSLAGRPSVSAVVRCFFRLALEGKVPRAEIEAAMATGRAVLNVTLNEAPRAAPIGAPKRMTVAELSAYAASMKAKPLTPTRKRK